MDSSSSSSTGVASPLLRSSLDPAYRIEASVLEAVTALSLLVAGMLVLSSMPRWATKPVATSKRVFHCVVLVCAMLVRGRQKLHAQAAAEVDGCATKAGAARGAGIANRAPKHKYRRYAHDGITPSLTLSSLPPPPRVVLPCACLFCALSIPCLLFVPLRTL